jgi:hypothetical protein
MVLAIYDAEGRPSDSLSVHRNETRDDLVRGPAGGGHY